MGSVIFVTPNVVNYPSIDYINVSSSNTTIKRTSHAMAEYGGEDQYIMVPLLNSGAYFVVGRLYCTGFSNGYHQFKFKISARYDVAYVRRNVPAVPRLAFEAPYPTVSATDEMRKNLADAAFYSATGAIMAGAATLLTGGLAAPLANGIIGMGASLPYLTYNMYRYFDPIPESAGVVEPDTGTMTFDLATTDGELVPVYNWFEGVSTINNSRYINSLCNNPTKKTAIALDMAAEMRDYLNMVNIANDLDPIDWKASTLGHDDILDDIFVGGVSTAVADHCNVDKFQESNSQVVALDTEILDKYFMSTKVHEELSHDPKKSLAENLRDLALYFSAGDRAYSWGEPG